MMEFNKAKLAEICTTLFEVATEAIFIVDKKGVINLLNEAAENIFGYQKDELKGQKIEVLIPQDKRHTHENHRDKYNKNPSRRKMGIGLNLNGVKKDGSMIPVEISLSHFQFDDEFYAMALITDITGRKLADDKILLAKSELEQKVKERTRELEANIERQKQAELEIQKAYEKEKELNELKSRFVSMASHEFKTPLANILTSATLIDKYQKEEQTENRTKHVMKIRKSVNTLNAILNDFLSLDRVESGAINFNEITFDFVALCAELIDQLDLLLKEGQQIILDCQHSELLVNLDKNAVKHIIGNLLSNALKYSGEKSTIYVRIKSDEKSIYLEIEDKGIGIPEEEQKNMFSKFFRAKNSLNIQGTGLGLHIIKYYIELMNGSITFSSKEGEGTTFFIEIPCKS